MPARLDGGAAVAGGDPAEELLDVERLGRLRRPGQQPPQLSGKGAGELLGAWPAEPLGQGGQGRLGGPAGAVPVEPRHQLDTLEELEKVHSQLLPPRRRREPPAD